MREYIVRASVDGLLINSTPVQELVRCQECKWRGWVDIDDEVVFCKRHSEAHVMEWFCADGEKE